MARYLHPRADVAIVSTSRAGPIDRSGVERHPVQRLLRSRYHPPRDTVTFRWSAGTARHQRAMKLHSAAAKRADHGHERRLKARPVKGFIAISTGATAMEGGTTGWPRPNTFRWAASS